MSLAHRSRLTISFEYHDTPPSFNAVGHSGNRWSWTKKKKQWQEALETLLMATGMPRGWNRIEAFVELRFPHHRRRDVVNYRTLLEKSLGDALVNGGWLPDDTPEHFRFIEVVFDDELGSPRTTIRLEAK